MTFKTNKIKSTVKKFLPYTKLLSKKTVYEALFILSEQMQKVPRYLVEELTRAIETMNRRNLPPSYMYIQGIVVQKRDRRHRIEYKARGKTGYMARDMVDLKILFGRKTIKDFYKEMVMGRDHSNISYLLKEQIRNDGGEYEDLRSVQWLVTSKGRQQQRLLLKRRALYKYLEFKRVGVKVSLKVLLEKEAEKEAVEFMREWGFLFDNTSDSFVSLAERRELYEKRSTERDK